jgi:membrane protein implicated in regulation of membrane protease activity
MTHFAEHSGHNFSGGCRNQSRPRYPRNSGLAEERRMREFLRDNGLSLVLFALFLASIVGQSLAGWYALGAELAIHGQPPPSLRAYLAGGHFLSATFENWESEFLQMTIYVVLTAVLIQKGRRNRETPIGARTSRLPGARTPRGRLERVGCGFGCTPTR